MHCNGAQVEYQLGHRATRDLDLFLHGRATLEEQAERAAERLRSAGMEVTSIQSGRSLQRYRVARGGEFVLLDLVADPVPVVEAPTRRSIGATEILVDTPPRSSSTSSAPCCNAASCAIAWTCAVCWPRATWSAGCATRRARTAVSRRSC